MEKIKTFNETSNYDYALEYKDLSLSPETTTAIENYKKSSDDLYNALKLQFKQILTQAVKEKRENVVRRVSNILPHDIIYHRYIMQIIDEIREELEENN